MRRNVVCMKGGKAYAPDYVNVLASAVRQHLTGDHWRSHGGRETVDAIGPLRDGRGRPLG